MQRNISKSQRNNVRNRLRHKKRKKRSYDPQKDQLKKVTWDPLKKKFIRILIVDVLYKNRIIQILIPIIQ